jgi:indole-3-glycerol phosphate synthase
MDILEQIVADKRQEVVAKQQAIPLKQLINQTAGLKSGRSLKAALLQSNTGIIAEFKRKSPSKGYIHQGADVTSIVRSYEQAGCAGISVLTDFPYFGGMINDLKLARTTVDCPLLRKDFMVDPYQLYEAKLLGADVILLIAACLSRDEAYDLGELAHELGMEVLLEVHSEEELNYISRFTDLVGVNNRQLKTFVTDVQTSFDLVSKIPDQYVKVSESGLDNPAVVRGLKEAGYNGFLMGERFMKFPDPGAEFSAFLNQLTNL